MQENDIINPARFRLIFWSILLGAMLVGAAFIFLRVVDYDEGFYLSSANLIWQGERPYLDFFFPQMPFLPIVLAPLSGFGLDSLFLVRAFGFICHLLSGLLIYKLTKALFNDSRLSLIALALTIFCGPILSWNSLAKPYFLSSLFLIGSFFMLVQLLSRQEMNYRQLFLTFLFLGITFNICSIFIIFVPLYFFMTYFYFKSAGTLRLKFYLPVILAGLLFPSLYALRLFIESAQLFLFNNLGYHLLREQAPGLLHIIQSKLLVLGKVLIQPQYLLTLGLALWSLYILNSHKYRSLFTAWHRMVFHLALVMSIFILIVYLIPHPSLVQYFNQVLLFLIIASLPAVKIVLIKFKTFKYALAAAYMTGFLIYPALYIADVRSKYVNYRIGHVDRVTKFIRANSDNYDTILSEWPAYYVFAGRQQNAEGEYCGFQYIFSSPVVPYDKYKLLSNDKINSLLKNQEPKLVIISNYVIEEWKKELENNYQILTQFDDTYIYERKSGGNYGLDNG